MGITHLSILSSNPKIKVTAACDPSKVVNTFFKKYFPGIKLYPGYRELINSGVDAVIISTPPHLHYEAVKEAAEKGIHVFAEKPFTVSYAQASELASLAEQKGIINQAGYVNRFNDVFVKAKDLVCSGVIGKISTFRSEMFSNTVSKEDSGEGWRGNPETGGGCLNEMASHALDLVNYIIGKPDKITDSVLTKIHSRRVDDIVSSTLIYNNGINGKLYVNWSDPSYRKPANKFEISGTEGKMFVDQHGLKIFMEESKSEFNLKKGWNTIYITDIFNNVPFYVRGNEFTKQLYHFADCIEDSTIKNLCTFRDAADTQEIIHLIRKDHSENGGRL